MPFSSLSTKQLSVDNNVHICRNSYRTSPSDSLSILPSTERNQIHLCASVVPRRIYWQIFVFSLYTWNQHWKNVSFHMENCLSNNFIRRILNPKGWITKRKLSLHKNKNIFNRTITNEMTNFPVNIFEHRTSEWGPPRRRSKTRRTAGLLAYNDVVEYWFHAFYVTASRDRRHRQLIANNTAENRCELCAN